MNETIEKFFLTLEFYLKNFIATISIFIAIVALSILTYFVVFSTKGEANLVEPIYDPVQLVEYQACLENRVTGTMWYWSKENVLSQCAQFAPTKLAP